MKKPVNGSENANAHQPSLLQKVLARDRNLLDKTPACIFIQAGVLSYQIGFTIFFHDAKYRTGVLVQLEITFTSFELSQEKIK